MRLPPFFSSGMFRPMEHHIYKTIQIVGTSPDSVEDAVNKALAKASKTIDNLRWFTVEETRGSIEQGAVAQWQVTIKASFTLKE